MTRDVQAPPPSSGRPQATLQLGPLRLRGWSAAVAMLLVLTVVAVLIVRTPPALSNWPVWVSAVLWIAFIAYWGAAAAHSAPTVAAEPPAARRVHERLLNMSYFLLFVPIPGFRVQVLPATVSIALIGLSVQSIFFALAVWARRHLGLNWSAAITAKTDHQLIRSGPYAAVRHPIYTAMIGMFVGTAIASGTVHAWLAVVLISVAYVRKIRMEERQLHLLFGEAYEDYRRRSGALIPWVL